MLNKIIILGLCLSMSSCMYKPTNEFCIGFYTLQKKSFDSLFQIQKFLFKDSTCSSYTVQYTAKFLLHENCDSLIHPNANNSTLLLTDSIRARLKNLMDSGKMDFIVFYPDSISIRFKNYNNPENNPFIVLFNKSQISKKSSEVVWLDSCAYLIPMR